MMTTNSPNSHQDEKSYSFIEYRYNKLIENEMINNSILFRDTMSKRRSIREFSSEPVPLEVVENAIRTACTSPSGANKQPWHFCLVSNQEIKSQIRKKAEEEELRSYTERMSDRWLADLEPLGTDHIKPFLEEAPYLIVVFKKPYDLEGGKKVQNYYVNESVGISVGILIAALQNAGLVTLTHTPSPMNFLSKILNRPENERAYLLLPVGYPKEGTKVPDIQRKGVHEVYSHYL